MILYKHSQLDKGSNYADLYALQRKSISWISYSLKKVNNRIKEVIVQTVYALQRKSMSWIIDWIT